VDNIPQNRAYAKSKTYIWRILILSLRALKPKKTASTTAFHFLNNFSCRPAAYQSLHIVLNFGVGKFSTLKMASSFSQYVEAIVNAPTPFLSSIHVILLLAAGITYNVVSSNIKRRERWSFSCEIPKDQDTIEICRSRYDSGPNEFYGWLFAQFFTVPMATFLFEALLKMWKLLKRATEKRCTILHFHLLYFLKLAVIIGSYLRLTILVFIRVDDLTMDTKYDCQIWNSTFHCVDPEAKSKSDINIVYFSLTIFLLGFAVIEFAYYFRKWIKAKKNKEDKDFPECKDCKLFSSCLVVFVESTAKSAVNFKDVVPLPQAVSHYEDA